MCRRRNRTHILLRARQMPKPLGHQLPRIHRSVTNVLIDKFFGHGEHYKQTNLRDKKINGEGVLQVPDTGT